MPITSTHGLTVGELIGDTHDVWLRKTEHDFYELTIESFEDTSCMIKEQVHPYAIEELACFCERFLHVYNKLNKGN